MYIKRDITQALSKSPSVVQILIGPRQCGKSTLLYQLSEYLFKEITFDD
jgi:predicted AAA+ superfamily ATPase